MPFLSLEDTGGHFTTYILTISDPPPSLFHQIYKRHHSVPLGKIERAEEATEALSLQQKEELGVGGDSKNFCEVVCVGGRPSW